MFLTTLKTEQIDKWNHVLLDDLIWFDEIHGKIVAEAGFLTNFASLKTLHNILLFPFYALVSGYGNYACTIHDKLYATALVSRREADDVLYRALRAEGVAKWRAGIFWLGTRVGGAKHYNEET